MNTDDRLAAIDQLESFRQLRADRMIELLESIDRRLSHIEDWCGDIKHEIKEINRVLRK